MNRGVAGTSKAYGRLSTVRRIWALCGVLSIGLPLGLLQAKQFTIRADVPLVSLDVAVSDSAGRPVTNLKQSDFLIYEDGQPRTCGTFLPPIHPTISFCSSTAATAPATSGHYSRKPWQDSHDTGSHRIAR